MEVIWVSKHYLNLDGVPQIFTLDTLAAMFLLGELDIFDHLVLVLR